MKREELIKMIEEMQKNNDLRKVVREWSDAVFELGWYFALEKLKDKIKEEAKQK